MEVIIITISIAEKEMYSISREYARGVHVPGVIEEAALEEGDVNQRTVVVHELEEEYFESEIGKEKSIISITTLHQHLLLLLIIIPQQVSHSR